ncbi:MAG: hypothetical protein GY811_24190 [Myxococcales bacterium]|nr:hypothetical protein [Myxococcales bacterium]
MRRFAGILALALCVSPACSNEDAPYDADAGGAVAVEFNTPTIDMVTPGAMALGDTVQVFGSDFLPNEYGSTRLLLSGTYTDDTGATHDYEGEIALDVKNISVASFIFDDLMFIPSRDRIGRFVGQATVISELAEAYRVDDVQSERRSEELSVSLKVEPSLGIVQLRSVSEDGCAAITKGSIGDQELALSMRAVGMAEATTEEPIRFRISFQSPTMKVVYLKDQGYGIWPTDISSLNENLVKEATEGASRFDVEITEGNHLDLDPTWRKDKVKVSPAIQIGDETVSEVLLGRFSTGATEGSSTVAGILVEATHPDGTVITRQIAYDVKEEWEVHNYDQNMRLMERSDPVPVSGCFSGGDIGRDLTYTEGSSITQSRSLSFRWDQNVANTLGLTAGVGGLLPYQISANASTTFSETFGIDVNETVSSESHIGINFSARIIPGFYGTCYRQVDRIEREVDVTYNNACGRAGVIGQTILTDWNFGFDIATGPSCDAPSDLDDGGNFEPEGIEFE